jgi:hypothetical protein
MSFSDLLMMKEATKNDAGKSVWPQHNGSLFGCQDEFSSQSGFLALRVKHCGKVFVY